jgi:hypothetical protein
MLGERSAMLHDCVGQEDFRRGNHLCFDQRYRHVENMSPARPNRPARLAAEMAADEEIVA